MGIRGFFWKVSDFLQVAEPKPFNIVAGRDGKLYEIRDSVFGRLVMHKKEVRELDEIKPGFQFNLPKIPSEILETALSFFRTFVLCDKSGIPTEHEVMVQIFWDTVKEKYLIECPYQRVWKTRIKVDGYPILNDTHNNGRYIQVVQIHSHNTMEAFFSGIDNEDEKAFMIYGVVGRLDLHEPDLKFRVGCNGEFIELPLDYIIDKAVITPTNTSFPEEWMERVIRL